MANPDESGLDSRSLIVGSRESQKQVRHYQLRGIAHPAFLFTRAFDLLRVRREEFLPIREHRRGELLLRAGVHRRG